MKYLILIIFTVIIPWEIYEYPNDPTISNKFGEPVSDSTYYFPLELFVDSIKWADKTEIKLDTFSVKWFSQDLWFSKEPILYNYYLDRTIYRLTWLRSFHPAIILRLEKRNDDVTLIEKKMTLVDPWKPVPEDKLTDEHRELLERAAGPFMEYRPDSAIIESKIRKISQADWSKFEMLLEENNFQSMPTTRAWEFGTDGSKWILEQHANQSYHVVNRWSPNEQQYSDFRELGDFMIDLSSYKKEERY